MFFFFNYCFHVRTNKTKPNRFSVVSLYYLNDHSNDKYYIVVHSVLIYTKNFLYYSQKHRYKSPMTEN